MTGQSAVPATPTEAPIFVESEWADLKECVYGSPDHWVLPVIYNDAKLRAQGGSVYPL